MRQCRKFTSTFYKSIRTFLEEHRGVGPVEAEQIQTELTETSPGEPDPEEMKTPSERSSICLEEPASELRDGDVNVFDFEVKESKVAFTQMAQRARSVLEVTAMDDEMTIEETASGETASGETASGETGLAETNSSRRDEEENSTLTAFQQKEALGDSRKMDGESGSILSSKTTISRWSSVFRRNKKERGI